MKRYLICTVTSLLLVTTFGQSQEAKSSLVTAQEYAVYSALLDEITQSPNDGKVVRLLVVNDRTEGRRKMCWPEEVAKFQKGIAADELKPLLADLLTKNDKACSLTKQFKLSRRYVLLNEEAVSVIFKGRDYEERWHEFYRKYPNSSGFITFSRVGFNKEGTRAIIYRETGCGSLCAYGGYILLNKEKGVWRVGTGYGCWQS